MNRQHRAHIAQETLTILETGVYTLPDGRTISLRADLERACARDGDAWSCGMAAMLSATAPMMLWRPIPVA